MSNPDQRIVYFDNNATTAVDPQVAAAMAHMSTVLYGNPSSLHYFATVAREAVDGARKQLGRLLGCRSAELVFTSGATEAITTAFASALEGIDAPTVVTTAVEHPAVLRNAEYWFERGVSERRVAVDGDGRLDMMGFREALADGPALAAVMVANNETGVLFPVQEIADLCREAGVPLLLDASQAVGKIPLSVRALKPDYLALSAHKFHGPKGVGALYVRRGARFRSIVHGGGQEKDRRSGTENVAGIVGLGAAAELASQRLASGEWERVAALRDALESRVLAELPETRVNGARDQRLPNTSNLSFKHASGEAILQHLDELGVAASSSSACSSNEQEPSHVLRAMATPESHIHGSMRIGLSVHSTDDEISYLLAQLPRVIERARAASPFVGTDQADAYVESAAHSGQLYCE